jgi:transcriptional regulator with XRE-family HTH domain
MNQQKAAGLGERLRRLVAAVHGGNMNAAARDVGVAQPTIRRIIEGEQEKGPRADVVQSIARYYNISLDWLMSGAGDEPRILKEPSILPLAEELRWRNLVSHLELPQPAAYILLAQPSRSLGLWSLDHAPETPPVGTEPYKKFVAAWRYELLACITWLELLIDTVGLEGAQKFIKRNATALALGDLSVAEELVKHDRVTDDDVSVAIERSQYAAGFSPELSAERAGRKAPARKKR